MVQEQRRFVRTQVEIELRGKNTAGTGQLIFQAADLSPGGTFLKSDLLLEQGDRLSLEFRLPGVDRLLRAHARIAWVRRFPETAEPSGMGVEFLAMGDDDRRAVTQMLQTSTIKSNTDEQ